ncbi:MAG: hypothetical protein IT184_16580 [Acidobacteria bacterium]|nr:hypothetical protein [Acidobacteriota bacterium]
MPSRAAAFLAHRRGLFVALALAWALVVARSAVYLAYEQAFFDSDQAVFGLMAKHLMEGRAFPLFCYGQTYMLAVDAWFAVPFFALAGPTVGALHASLVTSNLIVVTLVIVALHRHAGLTPAESFAAVVPLAFVPPETAATLLEAAGNVGPLLYVPLLWLLRNRPLWFGGVLGVGVLHREFTAYAVPVLLAQQAWDGSLWRAPRLRAWLVAGAAALATWQAGQALRPLADPLGPGTRGMRLDAAAGVGAVTERIEFVATELPDRVTTMLLEHMPGLVGGRLRRGSIAVQGHEWLFWPLAALLAAAAVCASGVLARCRWWTRRAAAHASADSRCARAGLPVFLLGVGLVAMASYVVTRPSDFFQDRYMLLALYLPVGAASLLFVAAPRWIRLTAAGCVALLAGGSAVDHLHLYERYRGGREPNEIRVLADALVARGTTVARAGYWRAYKLTFLTGERVKIASTDVVRIQEYQRLARDAGDKAITIQTEPCAGGERVAGHYLCTGLAAGP